MGAVGFLQQGFSQSFVMDPRTDLLDRVPPDILQDLDKPVESVWHTVYSKCQFALNLASRLAVNLQNQTRVVPESELVSANNDKTVHYVNIVPCKQVFNPLDISLYNNTGMFSIFNYTNKIIK